MNKLDMGVHCCVSWPPVHHRCRVGGSKRSLTMVDSLVYCRHEVCCGAGGGAAAGAEARTRRDNSVAVVPLLCDSEISKR